MKEHGMKQLLFIFFITLLTACSTVPDKKAKSTMADNVQEIVGSGAGFPDELIDGRVVYMQCVGGYEFSAHVQREEAWLFLPEGTKRLLPKRTVNGFEYSNGEYLFWLGREEGTLEVEGKPIKQCRNNKNKAIWEEAKLRGADYRAEGKSPNWTLELSLEGNTVFVGDKGATRELFKTINPTIDPSKKTSTYNMSNGDSRITIEIKGESCVDVVSGELFDTSVSITLNGKKFKGCGQALH